LRFPICGRALGTNLPFTATEVSLHSISNHPTDDLAGWQLENGWPLTQFVSQSPFNSTTLQPPLSHANSQPTASPATLRTPTVQETSAGLLQGRCDRREHCCRAAMQPLWRHGAGNPAIDGDCPPRGRDGVVVDRGLGHRYFARRKSNGRLWIYSEILEDRSSAGSYAKTVPRVGSTPSAVLDTTDLHPLILGC
jgi:hypothetical protein